jgi:hypothetical protein
MVERHWSWWRVSLPFCAFFATTSIVVLANPNPVDKLAFEPTPPILTNSCVVGAACDLADLLPQPRGAAA